MITTAGGVSTNHISRVGYGDYPDNTGDWTILIRYKIATLPTGYFVIFNLFDGAADYSDPYLYLGAGTGATDLTVESNIGGVQDTANFTAVLGTQYWAAVTYNSTTHIITFINNGVIIGTITVNLGTTVWDKLYILGDLSGNTANAASAAYCRSWNRILNSAELTTEAASITAVNSTGLIWDCPLQTSIDLTSHNNTLNQLTATGTITTDTTDPLLSVVAAPPTNVSPATATTIDYDSAVFQNTLTAAAATTVWHKFTPTITGEYGVCSFGDLVTYKPTVTVYEGLANANSDTELLDIAGIENGPIQFPATSGTEYYFKSLRNGAVTPATLQISLLKALNLESPTGSIAVNDDTGGFPLVLLDADTGYPIKFIQPFADGEGGSILTDGTLLAVDNSNNNLGLYDSDLTRTSSVAAPGGVTSSLDRISSNLTDTFLFSDTGIGLVNQILYLISASGVLNPTVFDLGAAGGQSVGLNNDASIVYYARLSAANTPILAWDMINNISLGTFVAGVANYGPGKDIIVLQDGSILVLRNRNGISCIVKRYNAAGAELSSYDYGDNGQSDNRMATAIDDPASFWTWLKGSSLNTIPGGFSQFINTKVSDGSAIAETPEVPQFEGGTYAASVTTNTPIRFGHSESCPFWITRVSVPPVDIARSGLYTVSGTGAIDAAKVAAGEGTGAALIRHDQNWIDTSLGTSENVKIPDPYYDTFLAGDE